MSWVILGSARSALSATALCGLVAAWAPAAMADEADRVNNGAYLLGLFNQACLPSRGNTDKVHAFAFEHHFVPITNPAALAIFVGPGDRGIAWQVPSPNHQQFALSIRGTTEACVVWAQSADPGFVEAAFRREVEAIAKPGLEVQEAKEETADTPVGQAKTISYTVFATDTKKGFTFTLTTAEHPGGPFQASIQIAKVLID